jgi:hypothetical protein
MAQKGHKISRFSTDLRSWKFLTDFLLHIVPNMENERAPISFQLSCKRENVVTREIDIEDRCVEQAHNSGAPRQDYLSS